MWSLIILGPFTAFIVMLIGLFVYGALRFMSKDDPHKLNQWVMHVGSRMRSRANREFWGAQSLTPTKYDSK